MQDTKAKQVVPRVCSSAQNATITDELEMNAENTMGI